MPLQRAPPPSCPGAPAYRVGLHPRSPSLLLHLPPPPQRGTLKANTNVLEISLAARSGFTTSARTLTRTVASEGDRDGEGGEEEEDGAFSSV